MPVTYLPHINLTIWQPKGLITLSDITEELSHFVLLEKEKPKFNRFSNLSECDFSCLNFEDVRQIYLLRKNEYKGEPVKSALFVKNDLQFGVARIYQTLMTETKIYVEIFKNPIECSYFLNVPLEILLPKP